MGTYEELKAAIQQVIRTNGNNEITGALLQNTLLSIVNVVGANATFAGIATPNTNPGTADQNVFYLVTEAGTYVNFNAIEVIEGETVYFSNKSGIWQKYNIGYISEKKYDKDLSNIIINHGGRAIKALIKSLYITSDRDISTLKFRIAYVSYNTYSLNHLGLQIRWFADDLEESDKRILSNTLYFPKWEKNVRLEYSTTIEYQGQQIPLKLTVITSDNDIDTYPNTGVNAYLTLSAQKDTTTFPYIYEKFEQGEQRIVNLENIDKDNQLRHEIVEQQIWGNSLWVKNLDGQRYYDCYLPNNEKFKKDGVLDINIISNTSTNKLVVYGNTEGNYNAIAGGGIGFTGKLTISLKEDYDFIRILAEVDGKITVSVCYSLIGSNSIISILANKENTINKVWVEGTNLYPLSGDIGYLINSNGTFGKIGTYPEAWMLKKWIRVDGSQQITLGVNGIIGDATIYNYAFYDVDKKLIGNVISSYQSKIGTIEVPENAYYFCACYGDYNARHQINRGNEIKPYEPYSSYWYTEDYEGEKWRFAPIEVKTDEDVFMPKKIYTTCNDITASEELAGKRNYALSLFIDHLLKLESYKELRFNATQRDNFPVFSHFDSYTSGAGWTWNEDNSIIKVTPKSASINKLNNEISFNHISVRNSATKGKFPKILCIGDSVTEGYLANVNKGIENLPNAYWQWVKMFFEFDKKQSGDNSLYNALLIGARNVATVKAQYVDDTILSFRACAEGKGGAKLSEYLRGQTIGGATNYFYDASIVENNKFSIDYWLGLYRTMDDNGVRLQGTAGQVVQGTDGKNYRIGTMVNNVESWDVCTPTHVLIQLGYNDGNRAGYLEDIKAMADIIQYQIPGCIVGFSLPDCPGTYFPELYPQYGNDNAERYPISYFINPAKSSHETFRAMNKLLITLDDESTNRYYVPTYFISPTADSAPCRQNNFASWLSSRDNNNMFNVQGYAAPNLHPNNHAHAAWGYEIYSWLKYTLAK